MCAHVLPDYDALLAISARGVWDPESFDLTPDLLRWPDLPEPVQRQLLGLFAGFVVGEQAVAEHLVPFAAAAASAGLRACLRAQQVEEVRHATATARVWEAFADAGCADLDDAAALAPPALVNLFTDQLPTTARSADADLSSAIALYHGLLEGVVFLAGQTAVRELAEQWGLPGIAGTFDRIERDERWHVALGVRALLDAPDGAAVAARLPAQAEPAAESWGQLVGEQTRRDTIALVTRRLSTAGLLPAPSAAA